MRLGNPVRLPASTFRESLDYLYSLQRFGIKLGLDNIRALLAALEHPEQAFPVVHVAGSNGKGSVCALLASILGAAGLRTGLYTSPHLHSFTERIQVDGIPASEADIASLTGEVRQAAPGVPATFFEFATALALLYFARREVDWAVLETGMGGRLDATNAVTPRLTVITSICRDHAAHLGDDLPTIAAEKAGIIKPGIPLVCAVQPAPVLAVLENRAAQLGSPCYVCDRDFRLGGEGDRLSFAGLGVELEEIGLGLAGAHQRQNLALALAAAILLTRDGAPVSPQAMQRGAGGTLWPGRLEWWRGRREVLLDGAHNEGGARALADYLAEFGTAGVRLVTGLKGDKETAGVLEPLLPYATEVYACRPPLDAAMAPEMLAAAAGRKGVPARGYDSPAAALAAALTDRGNDEIVVVAGSLFLVAAAREWLMAREGATL